MITLCTSLNRAFIPLLCQLCRFSRLIMFRVWLFVNVWKRNLIWNFSSHHFQSKSYKMFAWKIRRAYRIQVTCLVNWRISFTKIDYVYHLKYSNICLHCCILNVSADVSFSFLQMFLVEHTEFRTEPFISSTWVHYRVHYQVHMLSYS